MPGWPAAAASLPNVFGSRLPKMATTLPLAAVWSAAIPATASARLVLVDRISAAELAMFCTPATAASTLADSTAVRWLSSA